MDVINNDLANDFGNLVSRTHAMTNKFFGGKIPIIEGIELEDFQKDFLKEFDIVKEYNELMQKLDYSKALELIWNLIRKVNAYINKVEPWKEKDEKKLKVIINVLNSSVLFFAKLISPFMPSKADLIFDQFNFEKDFSNLKFYLIDKEIILNEKINLFKKWNINKELGNKKENNSNKNEKREGFSSLNLVVGKIVDIKEHPDSDKMFVEQIDIGENEPIQIVSGLKKYYTLDEMKNKKVVVLLNLKPAKLRGVKSNGMVLVSELEDETNVGLLGSDAEVGSRLILEDGTLADSPTKIKVDKFFEMDFNCDGNNVFFEGKKVFVLDKKTKEKKELIIDRNIKGKIC
jgi:methionyl-tRNA synthetase